MAGAGNERAGQKEGQVMWDILKSLLFSDIDGRAAGQPNRVPVKQEAILKLEQQGIPLC